MSAPLESLASYLPNLLVRRLATDPGPPTEPIAESFPAALLFANISGFTALTERLAERGPAGAEELTGLLNSYFGQLIDLINTHGGDVVKFAGDTLLALWPARAGLMPDLEEDLGISTQRAVQCALVVQQYLNTYGTPESVPLSVRLAVGTGQIFTLHLGGVYKRWEFLVTGKPLAQAATAQQQAQAGEIVISREAWALVKDDCVGHPLTGGNVRLDRMPNQLLPRPLVTPDLLPEAEAGLQAYIPGAIISCLTGGQNDWLAELRQVTVIFLNLPDLTYTTPLEQAQGVMRSLQIAVYHHEGSVNKISLDDKGANLIAVLGLPPLAHEDDAARGVEAALAMQATLQEMGLRGAIGVASGRVFCGSIGSTTRHEYTMIGEAVNLAVRLQAASKDLAALEGNVVPILCDEATYQAAQSQVVFETLSPITVPGKAEPFVVYRPQLEFLPGESTISRNGVPVPPSGVPAGPHQEYAGAGRKPKFDMVGRAQEKAVLGEELQALLRGSSGTVVIIEGEAGIGKSRLIEELVRHAQILNVPHLIGWGDAIQKSTPYYAWRPVFSQLFHLEALPDDSESRYRHILDRLEADPALSRLAPPLNAVLPLDLPENEITRQMSGEARADNTHNVLTSLLKKEAMSTPLLLILENVHWLDSASWALTRLVSQEVQPMMLVMTTRPLPDPQPTEYSQLLDAPGTQQLRLEGLSAAEALTLVRQRLGVADVPESVAALIREKAAGHPFYSEELACALRDADLIRISRAECSVDPDAGDLRSLDFPDTIQSTIASRIEQLETRAQLALKAASVIGSLFNVPILQEIYPVEADKPHLSDCLDTLGQLDLIALKAAEPKPVYIFKHAITREVAYNLLTFARRRELHRAVAEWYECNYADDLSPHYPLLAHHWCQAAESGQAETELVVKAVSYLEKAGKQALRTHANQEAAGFFSQALALDDAWRAYNMGTKEQGRAVPTPPPQLPTPPTQLRRARWEQELGQLQIGLGQLAEGREHLEQALALLDRPMPSTSGRLILGLSGQILRQGLHQVWPARFIGRSQEPEAVLLEATRAYLGLVEITPFAKQQVPALYAVMQALNLAEAAGPSPELARAYAAVCRMTGLVPLHALAEAYARRAQDIAERIEQLPVLANVLRATGLHYVRAGQWERAQDIGEQAVEIADWLGDRRLRATVTMILANVAYYRGEFVRCAALWADIYTAANQRGDTQQQGWALAWQAVNLLRLGQMGHVDEAVASLERSIALLFADIAHSGIISYGMLAVARLRQGQLQLARQIADRAAHLIAQSRPTAAHVFEGYAGVAEVYLALWEASAIGNHMPLERKALLRSARQACQALHRFARIFPIGQPRTWLCQGLYEWLAGKPDRAYKAWQKSLTAAERLAMPYEQGRAHYEIGRHLPLDDPARQEHLIRAREIFTQLEAVYELAREEMAHNGQLSLGNEQTLVKKY